MLLQLISALREAGGIEKSVSSVSFRGDTIPTGMFIVRRNMSVSEVVKQVLAAVLTNDPVIEAHGIKVKRPHQITILMTDLRKWEFTPAFPVSAQLIGIDVSVDMKSIELVRDEESGNPAVLFTTASSLRPNVMLICSTSQPSPPDVNEDAEIEYRSVETERLMTLRAVPLKHQNAIRKAVGTAWSRGVAQSCMARGLPAASSGQAISIEESEAVAEMIVEDLIAQKQIAGVGLFFWLQLGWWMIRIISELIRLGRSTAGQNRKWH